MGEDNSQICLNIGSTKIRNCSIACLAVLTPMNYKGMEFVGRRFRPLNVCFVLLSPLDHDWWSRLSVTASLTPLPSVLQETEDKRKTVGDSRALRSVLCAGSRWRTPALGLAFYRHCPGITISFVFECIVYEWNQVGEQNKWEHRRTSCVLESAVPALFIWIDSHNNRHSNRLSELLNTHAQCFGVKKKKTQSNCGWSLPFYNTTLHPRLKKHPGKGAGRF